jgi:catechol 2,3-dioxygenase-like lactoylglutathione lyase family enzyme
MRLALAHVTVDCRNAAGLAAFWSQLLEEPVDDGATEHFASIGLAGDGPRPALMFIQVPEPRRHKNRVHVDLASGEWVAEVERALSLGATRVGDYDEFGTRWTTLQDPEGNEFCIGAGTD